MSHDPRSPTDAADHEDDARLRQRDYNRGRNANLAGEVFREGRDLTEHRRHLRLAHRVVSHQTAPEMPVRDQGPSAPPFSSDFQVEAPTF